MAADTSSDYMVEEVIDLEKRCYSVAELQEILEISRQAVYELLKKKEFRWVLIGGKYRISKKSFDEWLDVGEVPAADTPADAEDE